MTAKWRIWNPVVVTTGAILLVLLLYWTAVLLLSEKPVALADAVSSYAAIVKWYFYPVALVKNVAAERLGMLRAEAIAFWTIWFLALVVSAQPYKPKLRLVGSGIGMTAVVVWTVFAFGLFFAAGLRH
jgi:hypothetical protein